MPMPRRALLLAPALALPAGLARAVPAVQVFAVLREGRDIGHHAVQVTPGGNGLVARNEITIQVRMVGITVFRMRHVYEERWEAGRLVAYSSRQDRNGTVTEFRARAEAGALLGDGGLRLPAEAAPLGWWDMARLGSRPLFDSADGKPLEIRWQRRQQGNETLCTASGAVEGEARYAADGAWLGFRQKAEDGSMVEYRREQ